MISKPKVPGREGAHRVGSMMLEPVSQFTVFLLGVFTMLWGAWVAAPQWSVFDKAPQYMILESLATEYVWGGLAIILGAVLIRSVWSGRTDPIRISSLILFYFWAVIAISYITSDWQILAWIPATFFALLHGYAYLNLTVHNRTEND